MTSPPNDAVFTVTTANSGDDARDRRVPRYPIPTAPGWAKALARRDRPRRARALFADLAYIVLISTGWLAGNLLGILGCAVAMFIVISHGHADVFFLHVDNLASRYVAAGLDRRAVFDHQLVQLFSIVLTATLIIRGPRFIARLRRDLRSGRQA